MVDEQNGHDGGAERAGALSRREALRLGLGAAGAAALGGALPRSVGAQATPAASPAASPGASPLASPTADGRIVSPVEGVNDAYTRLPDPFRSVAETPGRGGTVRAITIAYSPPVPPKGENRYWQELERRLGVSYEVVLAPQETYGEQTATLLAGGELPDLFYINPGQGAAPLNRAIQQGAFADLTDYLTGDALQQFPNLARYPDYVWRNVAIGGKIYGIPKRTQRNANIPFYRADWAARLGLAAPTNAGEARELFTAFAKNDPDGDGNPNSYGVGGWKNFFSLELFEEMYGVPNAWRRNEDGTLTAYLETDEFRQALEFMRGLWAEGAYHPDHPSLEFGRAAELFLAGTTGSFLEGFNSFFGPGNRQEVKALDTPEADVAGLVPFGHDGGEGVTHNLPGFFGFTGIPASVAGDEERVLELLRIADYLVAPFGSEEQRFLAYGLEGVHHELDENGAPVRTDQGETDRGSLVYFLDNSEASYFYPGFPGEAELAQDLAGRALSIGIENPVLGLVSEAQQANDAELTQLGNDRLTAIVTGREPLEAIDQWVADWRSRGGDQIRQEFQDALQNQ